MMFLARLVLPSERQRWRCRTGTKGRGLVRTGDQGFSLIEMAVAMGLFALIATFMATMLAGGMRGVLNGKRRQVATQEANRILEIARSLSFDAVGLVQSDPTIGTDPAIQTLGGIKVYASEPIVWAINPADHPFDPHTQTLTRGATSLTSFVYVTGVDTEGDGQIDLKRVTARVTWDNSGTLGPANEVRAQTLVSESGVITSVTGHDTTPLTGGTLVSGGNLTIQSGLLGLAVPAEINLPSSTGGSVFRAVSSASCTTRSASVNILDLLDLPGDSVSVTADDDSRTATPAQPSPQSKSPVLALPAGSLRNLIGPNIGSPISCQASAVPMASESGSGSLLSAVTAQTNVTALSGLLNWLFTVASVQTQPVSQQIQHDVAGGQREVFAQASAATGVIEVLKLPVIPQGLVRVDALSYGTSVRGSNQTPSQAPTVTGPAFTLRVFDNGNQLGAGCGNGIAGPGVTTSRSGSYCILTVNPAASGFQGFTRQISGTMTHNILNLLGLLQGVVNLSFTTSIDALPPEKTPLAGETGPNGEVRWAASYSPVNVTASLNATVVPILGGGIPLIDSVVNLNLGTARSEACAGPTCN